MKIESKSNFEKTNSTSLQIKAITTLFLSLSVFFLFFQPTCTRFADSLPPWSTSTPRAHHSRSPRFFSHFFPLPRGKMVFREGGKCITKQINMPFVCLDILKEWQVQVGRYIHTKVRKKNIQKYTVSMLAHCSANERWSLFQ